MTTIIVMAPSTFCIGLIPSYHRIGIWVSILLLLCKLAQGSFVGREYTGAAIFVAEYFPDRQRGFLGSFLEFGSISGFMLMVLLENIMGSAHFLSWGWRILFFWLHHLINRYRFYFCIKINMSHSYYSHTEG